MMLRINPHLVGDLKKSRPLNGATRSSLRTVAGSPRTVPYRATLAFPRARRPKKVKPCSRSFRTMSSSCWIGSSPGREDMERMSEAISSRPGWWKWYICVILGLATTINYLDRQALAVTSNRITSEFKLTDEQYGNLEMGFGLAFAFGAALFGVLVDRISVRWLYPTVLVLWSSVGFATGYVEGYEDLLVCRIFWGYSKRDIGPVP